MDELKEDKVLAIFAISALFVSVPDSNFGFMAYADDLSENDDREEKQNEKELKEQHKEDTSDNVKSSLSDDEKIELEIKRKELRLLEHEFRENIKNLKLEAKEQFNELKHELKIQDDDRKNKIRDRINELKEKYKDKIREHGNHDSDDLESYPSDYEGKKINVCHVTAGKSKMTPGVNVPGETQEEVTGEGDYWGECDGPDQTDEPDEGQNIKIELKEELESHSNEIR